MNPLDAVMEWYLTARDAMRVTERAVRRNAAAALKSRDSFYGMAEPDVTQRLDRAASELDRVVVLTLVAVFERILRERVLTILRARFAGIDVLHAAIEKRLSTNAEFWRFAEELVAVFVTVPENSRGQVRQLIRFRDWMAHAHYAAATPVPPPTNAAPRFTYDVLTDFLTQAAII